MRRFFLGQVLATLAAAAIVGAVFAVSGAGQKPLDSRIAAMAISSGGLYIAIIIFRFFVKNREWDRLLDVVFFAVVAATVSLMAWWMAVAVSLAISAWSIAVGFRILKLHRAGDRRRSWENPDYMLWIQFLATFASLLWLALR